MKLRILFLAGAALPAFSAPAEAHGAHDGYLRTVPARHAGLVRVAFVPPRSVALPGGFYFRGQIVFTGGSAVGWFCNNHRAVHYYERFLTAWADPEPDLEHYAAAARQGLERLRGERR